MANLNASERKLVANSLVFSGIGKDDFDRALAVFGARKRSFPKGSFIQCLGEPFPSAGIVLSGIVEGSFHNEGFGLIGMNRFESGEIFGVTFACSRTEKSPMQIRARTDADVLLLDFGFFGAGEDGSVESRLTSNMVRILAEQNLFLNRKIRIMGQRSIRDKLRVYLAECKTDGKGFAIVPYSQTDLASFLGVNRSALSREMSRMRGEGVLITDGSRMLLRNG